MKCVRGLFLDIKTSFNTIDHDILLNNLYTCGIRWVVYKWFKSYLLGRKHCVRVYGSFSRMGGIYYGVPELSVLGAHFL